MASKGSTHGIGATTGRVAPSHPATVCATPRIQSSPSAMTVRAIQSRPKGIKSAETTAIGTTRMPMTGTEIRLASRPYCAIWLKCAIPTGPVAAPATAEETTTETTGASHLGMRRVRCIWLKRSKTATSAVVAAKDIWKPGPSRASGRSVSTTSAAIATLRRLIARRSSIVAQSAAAAMMKARSVATLPPESAR